MKRTSTTSRPNQFIRTIYVLAIASLFAACSGVSGPYQNQVREQMQYNLTHTAYADSDALGYAIDHGISPDSAVIVLHTHK